MTPDWISGLLGGALIGAASGLLLLGSGRIAGISGIAGGLIEDLMRGLPGGAAGRRLTAENALFLLGALRIWRRDENDSEADNFAVERKFFRLSLLYLFLHFGAILAEALLRPWGLGGWA